MPLLESEFDIKNINKYSKTDLINICYNNYTYSDEPVSKSELQNLTKNELGLLIVDILKAKNTACKTIKKVVKSKPKSCDDYTMKDLKELCKRKKLSTSGTKAELCDRLNIKYSECKTVKFKKSKQLKQSPESSESESEENKDESESESSESESEENKDETDDVDKIQNEIKKYLKNKNYKFNSTLESHKNKNKLKYIIRTPENYDTCKTQDECDKMVNKRKDIANDVIEIVIKYLYETEKNNIDETHNEIKLNNKTIFYLGLYSSMSLNSISSITRWTNITYCPYDEDLNLNIFFKSIIEPIKNKLNSEQQEILDELHTMSIIKLKNKAKELNLNISGKTKNNIIDILFNYYNDELEQPTEHTESPEPTEHTELTDDEYKEIHNFIKEIINDNNKQNIILSNQNVLDLVEQKFNTRNIFLDYFIDNKFIYIYENFLSYLDVVKSQNKISFNEYINVLRLKKGEDIKNNEFGNVQHNGYYFISDFFIICNNIIKLNILNNEDQDKIIEYYQTFDKDIQYEFDNIFGDDNNISIIWEFCFLKLHNTNKPNIDILKHIKKDKEYIFYLLKEITTIPKKEIAELLKINHINKKLCDDLYITFMHYSNNKLHEIANNYIINIRSINTYFKKCIGGKCKLNVQECIDNQQNKREKAVEKQQQYIKDKTTKQLQYRENKIESAKIGLTKYEKKHIENNDIIYPDIQSELIPLGKDKLAEQNLIKSSKNKIQNLNKVIINTSNMKMPTKLENIAHCLKLI